jgi:hypothetical protein
MTELTPEAKQFLDEHRPDGTPSSAQKLRGRVAVLAALAAPSAAAAVSSGSAASGAAASGTGAAASGAVAAGAGVSVKVAVAVVACAAVVGGAVAVPAFKARVSASPPPVTLPVVKPAALPTPIVEQPQLEAPAPAPAKPQRPHHRTPPRPAVPAGEPAPEPPEAPAEDTLALELQMLSSAQTSMLDGHPAHALQVLDEYERRFGENGRMLEEVRGARVGVLCAMGRADEARSEYGRLTPGSPFFVRLRAKCW